MFALVFCFGVYLVVCFVVCGMFVALFCFGGFGFGIWLVGFDFVGGCRITWCLVFGWFG